MVGGGGVLGGCRRRVVGLGKKEMLSCQDMKGPRKWFDVSSPSWVRS